MDVTIIGAGNMGRGIGTRLVVGGNRAKILDMTLQDGLGTGFGSAIKVIS